jgi:L-threonylcarbamoyladenylate synthase
MSKTPEGPKILSANAPRAILDAAEVLRTGGLVAFPTETVYGLGADATQPHAVARIFEAKGRPRFNPLIAHLPNAERVAAEVILDARAERLAAAFWPGPLTLVLRRRDDGRVAELARAGLATLAVRVPAHPVARALLAEAGRPVVAPSANASGQISPTTAAHVARSLGAAVDRVLDGGACAVGVESTILDLTQPTPMLLRPGGVPREALAEVVGPIADPPAADDDQPNAPGRLASHYAPARPLRLNARSVNPDEGLLAFGPDVPPGAAVTYNLSPTADPREAAAHLFAGLHALDAAEVRGLAAMPIPDTGLGAAINDRLRRAAAPRGPARG